jgi:hypothetical protein
MVDPKPLMIPDALREALAAEAANEGVSLEDITVQAVEAHLEAIKTRKFFEERRRRADPAWLLRFLDREGGLPPEPNDELPGGRL